MKKSSMAIIVIIFLLGLVFIWLLSSNRNVDVPERLANIPVEAKWVGGSDGGCWFQVLRSSGNNTFHIKVYNDYTGELDANSLFTLDADCALDKIDSATLIQSIDGFDGTRVMLTIPKEGRRCTLTPQ